MGRQLRIRLDFVIPNLSKHVQDAQAIQKYHHDQHTKNRSFVAGDRVLAVVLLIGYLVLLKQF